jgi:hypothetical protein
VANSTNIGGRLVRYILPANTSVETRTASFRIDGQTFTVTQLGGGANTNPAPVIRVLSGTANTGANVKIDALEGRIHVTEVSDDLLHWTPIRTNSGSATFTDSSCTNKPFRFYRVFELP